MRARMAAALLSASVLASACGGSSTDPLRLCARLSSCALDDSSLGAGCGILALATTAVGGSKSTADRALAARLDCIQRAGDCDATKACLQATSAEAAACAGGMAAKCDGDVVVSCDGSTTPSITDCGAAGLVCGAGGTSASCGLGSCDPKTSPPSCDGSVATVCSPAGVLTTKDCLFDTTLHCSSGSGTGGCQSKAGDACQIVDGAATCVGTGDACDEPTFQNRCDGTTMVTCTGGKIGKRDCAALDAALTCRLDTDGAAVCDTAAQECDGKTAETCVGGVATLCYLGKVTQLDCSRYGLSGCTTFQDHDGATFARCTP